jgi:hypothetical protein
MMFDVIEDNATWWIRLGRGRVWIGPFAEREDAAWWAEDFTGQDENCLPSKEFPAKRKRFRIVGGAAA